MKKLFFTLSLFTLGLADAQHHWGYEGSESPEHWGETEGNEKCNKSKAQSPINIPTSAVIAKKATKMEFHYDTGDVKDIIDNGHTLQFDFNEGNYVTHNNKKYFLLQFHAHEESEHTVDGIRYPLELHFVHKALDGSVLVIGVMAKEGLENSYFEKLKVFKNLAKNGKEDTDIIFNPEKMFPHNKAYYTYSGSLTTPPCSDNVTWILFKTPIEMTEDEIKDIANHLPKSNNRPIQPLNGRVVSGTK
ncbi:carbonic anhydrase family protein [Chryseobacterium sp.]|uniref:carbonic anhydrase n=1 Tax=Chryseobacterium sp. TaxID=1871047 RepID=UPI0025B95F1C|nr:carbonic anhydrase family protein [Chryseobacterium sp.]